MMRILMMIVMVSIMACGYHPPAMGASAALPTSDIITKGPVADVRAWGAKPGDNVDDRVAWMALLNSTAKDIVCAEGQVYDFSDTLTISRPLTLRGGCTLRMNTGNKKLINITSSDVTISGLKIVGPQYAAQQSLGAGIWAEGASAAAPIKNLRLDNVSVSNFGQYGIYMKFVDGFRLVDPSVKDVWYAGIYGVSVLHGGIDRPVVDNVIGTPNSYGIALTRQETDSYVTDPRSADVIVTDSRISRVAWEGLDTHGGTRIKFQGGEIKNCYVGVAVVGTEGAGQVPKGAPLDVSVLGMTIDSGRTDGLAGPGISFVGAAGSIGTPVEKATGIIAGNVIRNHGSEALGTSGGIYLRDTQGLVLGPNVLINCSPSAVLFYHDNYDAVVTGLSVVDSWSNTLALATGIYLNDAYNTVTISGNSFSRDTKTATSVMTNGIRIANSAGNKVTLGTNASEATYYIIDNGETHLAGGVYTGSKTWDPPSVANGAYTTTTVTVDHLQLGDVATAGFSLALPAGVTISATPTASNTATVTISNASGAPVDLSSGILSVVGHKR